MKLAREAERSGRETAEEVVQRDSRRLEKRKAHVKAAVECLIWTEAESDDSREHLTLDLGELLQIETQDAETFESEPVDAQIKRLCDVLGLPSPLAGEGGLRSRSDEGSKGPQEMGTKVSKTTKDTKASWSLRAWGLCVDCSASRHCGAAGKPLFRQLR
jgi:hypothetical protein